MTRAVIATPNELARIRTMLTDAMATSVLVRRRTAASDGAGGTTYTWATVATTTCRLEAEGPPEATEQLTAEQLLARARFYVVMSAAIDVRPQDRLSISGAYEVDVLDAFGAKGSERTLVQYVLVEGRVLA